MEQFRLFLPVCSCGKTMVLSAYRIGFDGIFFTCSCGNKIAAQECGTQAAHANNSAMLEIASILRDIIRDLDDFLPIETGRFYERIDSVVAQLQQ